MDFYSDAFYRSQSVEARPRDSEITAAYLRQVTRVFASPLHEVCFRWVQLILVGGY